MRFVAEDGLFLGGHPAKAGAIRLPLGPVANRDKVKADDGNRQAVEHTVPVLGQIEGGQAQSPDLIDRSGQESTAPVKAGALRLVGKEIPMRVPVAEQDRLLIPAPALADHRHRHQFGILADRCRTRTTAVGGDLWPHLIDTHRRPQAEVVKILYHREGLLGRESASSTGFRPDRRPFLQVTRTSTPAN